MKKTFDLTTIYHPGRPLSWSAIASFQWNPSQWYAKYVAKELPEVTPELEFGSMVDKKIQDNPKFLPKLVRYPVLQHEMRGTFDGIPLLGFADAYRPPSVHKVTKAKVMSTFKCALRDYKTGRKDWTQKRADETGQITMYLLMLWLRDKIKPEDVECYIDWLPTHIKDGKITFIKEGDIHTFKTKRTMADVLKFGNHIKKTWVEMEEYATRRQGSVSNSLDDW